MLILDCFASETGSGRSLEAHVEGKEGGGQKAVKRKIRELASAEYFSCVGISGGLRNKLNGRSDHNFVN